MNSLILIFIITTLAPIAFSYEVYPQMFTDLINSYKKELEECKISLNQYTTAAEKSFYGTYRWEDMRMNYVLPEDVVYGGQNVGLQPLFIVRGKGNNYNNYGKLPMPYTDRNAYLTNESSEYATAEFQILTAKGYSWCRPNSFDSSTIKIDPICRARYQGFLTPGTLVGNKCRVGWGRKVHIYDEYEVLIVGSGCA